MQLESIQGFRSTKLYDILIATPLLAFYGFAITGTLIKLSGAAADVSTGWLGAGAQIGNLFYWSLVVAIVFVRRVPVARMSAIWPRILALVSGNAALAVALLPAVKLSPLATALSGMLSLSGTIAAFIVLLWLGRSFSIVPEARRLVTDGPYRHIRHPLYLADFVSSIGVSLQFAQPWALLLTVGNFALQLWRMRYEEQVLAESFPEYAGYAARTWRLLPGWY